MNRTLIACGALLAAALSLPTAAQLKLPADSGKPSLAAPAASSAAAPASAPATNANANAEK